MLFLNVVIIGPTLIAASASLEIKIKSFEMSIKLVNMPKLKEKNIVYEHFDRARPSLLLNITYIIKYKRSIIFR